MPFCMCYNHFVCVAKEELPHRCWTCSTLESSQLGVCVEHSFQSTGEGGSDNFLFKSISNRENSQPLSSSIEKLESNFISQSRTQSMLPRVKEKLMDRFHQKQDDDRTKMSSVAYSKAHSSRRLFKSRIGVSLALNEFLPYEGALSSSLTSYVQEELA